MPESLIEGPPEPVTPPLLTGGVLHPLGVRVDYLTVTLPDAETPGFMGDLLAFARLEAEGKRQPGFSKSEERVIHGGTVWRRFEPLQGSREFGPRYESWLAPAGAGETLALWLRGRKPSRPSRVDVAFDFEVADDFTPESFLRLCEIPPKVKQGVSGEDDVNTRYVGAKKSERRVKIYRKDRESAGWAEIIGPTLRVEVTMADDRAARWWRLWHHCTDRAMRAAAGEAFDLLGVQLVDRLEPLPSLEIPEAIEPGELLFQFIHQHGDMLEAARRLGIDLGELAAEHHHRRGRMARSRLRRRLEAFKLAGVPEAVRVARTLLGRAEAVPVGDVQAAP